MGADQAYDKADFVETCTASRVKPHVARNRSGRHSNIGDDVAASAACLAKTRHRGLAPVDWQFTLALAAYNLIRLPKLLPAPS